jgi:hypothetical protein
MELNETDLEEITRLAGCAYSPREIAAMMGIEATIFIKALNDEESAASIAYFSGLNSSEATVRESVMQLARNGSSPAQAMAMKLFDENKKNMRKDGFE